MPKEWKLLQITGKMADGNSAKHNAYDILTDICKRYNIGAGELVVSGVSVQTSGYMIDFLVFTDQEIRAEVTIKVPNRQSERTLASVDQAIDMAKERAKDPAE